MAEENINGNTEQNEQNTKTENIKFYSLAPVESDNYDKYKDAFNFALNDNDEESKKITNIAVTGPYASGKSSVIEKVRKKNKEKNFITLSLTNFNSESSENQNQKEIIIENTNTNTENSTNTEKDNNKQIIINNTIERNKTIEYHNVEHNKKLEENLEAQLINQLIHKIDSKKIKDSRFLANKKIDTQDKKYKDKNNQYTNSILLAVILLIIINIDYNILIHILQINDNDVIKDIHTTFGIIKIFAFLAFIITSIINFKPILFKLISLLRQRRILKKINIYGSEIELFSSEEESIFDKYTDEILYLFEKSGANIFIFEDIDRYEDVTIFKKLREINILLNEKLKIEKKKPIKFIYIICDNMFTAEERTKFFDFIIPIVPYIHKGNSYDYMASLFKKEIQNEKNKKFLIRISFFIDNSRIINNIVNEYYIYNKFIKLKDREPHTKFIKLLSLLIYKNTFPKDFEQLYINKGYLAELFNKEEFIKLVKLEDFTQYTRDNEYSILGENNPADNMIIYKEHIKETKTIREILKIIYNKDLFFTAPKGYDYIYNGGYFNLIKFLVTNGYIDETYKDYMSEISENSLTYAERVFLQNIFIKDKPLEEHKMANIYEKQNLDNLKSFLEENDYEIISILNIDFFLALLKFNDEHKLKLIINIVKENKKYNFILKIYVYIIKSEKTYNEFNIKYFEKIKELIIGEYEEIKNCFKDEKNEYNELFYQFMLDFITIKKEIFINKKEDDFLFINNKNISIIENDISNDICYTEILNKINNLFIGLENNYKKLNVANIIHVLKDIGIKFSDIQNITDKKILKDILNYYMFQPTYNNIIYILQKNDNTLNDNSVISYPYKSLINAGLDTIKQYVDNNITYFLKSYPEEIQTLEDNKLLDQLNNSDKITEDDREELKIRFNIK